jgi:hypothetical protein
MQAEVHFHGPFLIVSAPAWIPVGYASPASLHPMRMIGEVTGSTGAFRRRCDHQIFSPLSFWLHRRGQQPSAQIVSCWPELAHAVNPMMDSPSQSTESQFTNAGDASTPRNLAIFSLFKF